MSKISSVSPPQLGKKVASVLVGREKEECEMGSQGDLERGILVS